MKNRSQPFECTIAGKTVGISLRHGGGLQEPETVYVRCDERDCQYVDLNQPPCPLRVDMFADGSDRRVVAYLHEHAGERVCYACLTETLSVSHDQVRRASWRLKDEPGFTIRPARCVSCRRRRVTIGLTRDSAPIDLGPEPAVSPAASRKPVPSTPELDGFLRGHTGFAFCAHCLARELGHTAAALREAMWTLEAAPGFLVRTAQCVSCLLTKRVIRHDEVETETQTPRRVIDFLVQAEGLAYCASCIALSTDTALADVRRVLGAVEVVTEFTHREGVCAACSRWQPVVSFKSEAETDEARVGEIGDVLTGRLHYRGFLVALLSFRVHDGWRPFALVKTRTGAIVPDAPTILLGIRPTKTEADDLAAVQAREWIDKRFV
jgi:hypothetical protein